MDSIPTEPIGSIPRPPELLRAIEDLGGDSPKLDALYEGAIKDPVEKLKPPDRP